MSPDDYRAIVAIVPYVDAVTTMLDPGGRFQQAQVHAEYMAFALWELGYR